MDATKNKPIQRRQPRLLNVCYDTPFVHPGVKENTLACVATKQISHNHQVVSPVSLISKQKYPDVSIPVLGFYRSSAKKSNKVPITGDYPKCQVFAKLEKQATSVNVAVKSNVDKPVMATDALTSVSVNVRPSVTPADETQKTSAPVTGSENKPVVHSVSKSAVSTSLDKRNVSCTATSINFSSVTLPTTPASTTESADLPAWSTGKVNAKIFKPRHCNIDSLQIGRYKVPTPEADLDKKESLAKSLFKTARLKAIFSHRKLVYEYSGDFHGFIVVKPMTIIEVPFTSIVAMNLDKCSLKIEVNCAPKIFKGTQRCGWNGSSAVYDRSAISDVTNGEALRVPYHEIENVSPTLCEHLCAFDLRFDAMLKRPWTKHDKILPAPQPKKSRKRSQDNSGAQKGCCSSSKSSAAKKPRESDSCRCTSGCSSARCQCAKNGKTCEDCSCKNCKNPFKILAEYGVNISAAKEDNCLMQNIFKIRDLRGRLEATIEMQCCSGNVPVYKMIPGAVPCGDEESTCGEYEWKYSWCRHELTDEDHRPRYHCSVCRRCGDYRDEHCNGCNRCYFAGLSGIPCPNCSQSDDKWYSDLFSFKCVSYELDSDEDSEELDSDEDSNKLCSDEDSDEWDIGEEGSQNGCEYPVV